MSSANSKLGQQLVTGYEAGLTGDQQIRLALQRIAESGGMSQMGDLYAAIEEKINPAGYTLSDQGRASLRFFINRVAVEAGYVHPHDKDSPGWRITAKGRELLASEAEESELAIDVDTGIETSVASNTARGDAFETYILKLLRAAYPNYAWYHQGRDKRRERGVDFVGNRIGDAHGEPASIGVQVKFHAAQNAPTEREWLKFMAGCFSRRLDSAIFVTSGKLTGEQRREAQEARVVVIEGQEEILRLSAQHNIERFDLFDEAAPNKAIEADA